MSEDEQQMMIPPMAIPPQAYMRQETETIKFRLDNDELIVNIEHDLKGEHWVREQMMGTVKNEDGKIVEIPLINKETGVPILVEHWKKVGVAKCNDYGAKALSSAIRTMIGKNTILSDLDEEDIKTICRNILHTLNNLIEDRHDDYGIDAIDIETIIFTIIGEPLFISLKRAEQGRERDSISKIQTVSEVHNVGGQHQGFRIPFTGGGN
jgi:hypothetical protein